MGNRREQRTRIALPVKVVTRDAQNRPLTEMACSIDISPKGARLTGVRSVKAPGEVISVERGKSKAFFQVKWVGSREHGTEAQVGLFCIEPGSSIWGLDLLPGDAVPAASVARVPSTLLPMKRPATPCTANSATSAKWEFMCAWARRCPKTPRSA